MGDVCLQEIGLPDSVDGGNDKFADLKKSKSRTSINQDLFVFESLLVILKVLLTKETSVLRTSHAHHHQSIGKGFSHFPHE